MQSSSTRKPARVQLDPTTINSAGKPEQTGQVFNIWYSKWTGGENNGKALLTHSKTRCHIEKDSGYTKADKYSEEGAVNRDKFICLYFARGYCCNGKNCDYLHRIPSEFDFFPTTLDCFGREKFSSYRDDMSGIGSFNNVNRTLYVGRIVSLDSNVELLISKSFSEFGDIERMRIIRARKIAFITYKLESQAQFAKEAMHGQSILEDNINEALNIRWANDDPDPKAQKRKRDELEKTALETAKKLFKSITQNVQENELQNDKTRSTISKDNSEQDRELKIPTMDVEVVDNNFFQDKPFHFLRQLREKRKTSGAFSETVKLSHISLNEMLTGYQSDSEEDTSS